MTGRELIDELLIDADILETQWIDRDSAGKAMAGRIRTLVAEVQRAQAEEGQMAETLARSTDACAAKELEVTGKMLDGTVGAWAKERTAHNALRHAIHCIAEGYRESESVVDVISGVMKLDRTLQKSTTGGR